MTAGFLRKKYPKFIFENFSYKISKEDLEIFFDFKIPPDIEFRPKLTIKNVEKARIKKIRKKVFNNLIFHLGLIELLSYWKTTCSPEIEIKSGKLNENQIKWWKNLIINGMGQFFYKNRINWTSRNFLILKSKPAEDGPPQTYKKRLKEEILIPIGGGKDSIVTLELLKNSGFPIKCFSLNPTETTKKVMEVGKCQNPIIVKREIDSNLYKLNQRGFLNGHTPFSAYLAFLSTLLGVVFNKKYIAFSNERSSNEGNLKYLGKEINHQYSKSFDFEQKFRKYSKKYLSKDIEYFSFLRPLYEIQIARLFSHYPNYFDAFLSCNEAYRTHSGTKTPIKQWCGKCPKCLFVFTCLYPFIEKKDIIRIFKENLFQKKELTYLMKELIGVEKFKPFECVGTKKESLIAFYLSWKKNKKETKRIPYLLRYFEKNILPKYTKLERKSKRLLNSWNKNHNLSPVFTKILKKALK